MIRVAIVISQILCILLCPYICTARAAIADRGVATACSCCGSTSSPDDSEIPAGDEIPCVAECVSRAVPSSPAEFELPNADEATLYAAARVLAGSQHAIQSRTLSVGGLTHPELASGHAIRIRYASLLL